MAKLTLYAYAQGTDLDGVAPAIEERLDALVAERKWRSKDVWVVNQHEAAAGGQPETWDLGMNLALAAARTRPADWIEDLVAIATAFGELNKTTGRTFVLGLHDGTSNETKDLFFVEGPTPDLEALRAAFSRI